MQVPKPATISEIMQKDGEDESLRRYKESLLGAAAQGAGPRARVWPVFG